MISSLQMISYHREYDEVEKYYVTTIPLSIHLNSGDVGPGHPARQASTSLAMFDHRADHPHEVLAVLAAPLSS